MNRQLRDQTRASLLQGSSPTNAPLQPPTRRSISLPKMSFILAAVFGLYVFGGHHVLKRELQWSTISGQIFGRQTGSAIDEAIPSKVREADALVEPAVRTASGVAWAQTEAQAALFRENKRAEVAARRDIADIEVDQRRREGVVQAGTAGLVRAGEAYQECLARAAEQGRTAAVARAARPNATTGAMEAAGDIARMQAEDQCRQRKADEDAAQAAAANAAHKR